jgi:DNA polymerase V
MSLTNERTYIAIDLKSFYASVECQERGLDPLTANLVVADEERTDKTICLAVSPALKAYGIKGRPRLFEVRQAVKKINEERRKAYGKPLHGISADRNELDAHPEMELGFHIAVPRMSYYIQYSTRVYQVYLKFVAAEDIHVYSIDEVFMDVTSYLHAYDHNPYQMAEAMIHAVLKETGITATAGIGPNLYLAKIAMDIVAKHIPADADGVRIAMLDEMSYRYQLWDHQPLTDFWRIGPGMSRRLAAMGIHTMGDLARFSLVHQEKLYEAFGVNAELLIDHAWGAEPALIRDIRSYEPSSSSLSAGQVLPCAYSYEEGKLIVKEMADSLSFQLVRKHLAADHAALAVGFDQAMADDPSYHGPVEKDRYGRIVPSSVHGSAAMPFALNSSSILRQTFLSLYERLVPENGRIRRLTLNVFETVPEDQVKPKAVQLDLFADQEKEIMAQEQLKQEADKERKAQEAILKIREKYGSDAVIRGMDKEDKATALERNHQIGGHRK